MVLDVESVVILIEIVISGVYNCIGLIGFEFVSSWEFGGFMFVIIIGVVLIGLLLLFGVMLVFGC